MDMGINVVILGNGFDLAHGLPTSYSDFLEFIDCVNDSIDKPITGKKSNGLSDEQIEHIRKFVNTVDMKEWNLLVRGNFWIEYFSNISYKLLKNKWIDFEKEISQVIQSLDNDMENGVGRKCTLFDEMTCLSNDFLSQYYSQYTFTTQSIEAIGHNASFNSITFEQIRDKLYDDLNKLTRALEIYLINYVEKIDCKCISLDIKEKIVKGSTFENGNDSIRKSKILCFNYTDNFEKIYGKNIYYEVDYIHGRAKEDNTITSNNMVLGIDEYLSPDKKDHEIDFIAFKKFYQRIYKETGSKYKDWIEELDSKNVNVNLFIFGHSLDITDKDILREFILHKNVKTTIFYHNKEAYRQQIANLVKIITQDELIRRTGGSKRSIIFEQQREMIKK